MRCFERHGKLVCLSVYVILAAACASQPSTPKVVIPEYAPAEVKRDQDDLKAAREALARRSITFKGEKNGDMQLFYPGAHRMTKVEGLMLRQLVATQDRYLNKYNRDYRLDGKLVEPRADEMRFVRQERKLAKQLLEQLFGSEEQGVQPAAAFYQSLNEPIPLEGDLPTPEEMAKGRSKDDTRTWQFKKRWPTK